MSQPLKGVRVLDATHVLAGPFSTYQLALLGADVIRIESPHVNDIARHNDTDPRRSGSALGMGFLAQNANKRSVVLDLKRDEGRKAFRRIAMTCDVLVENFRPGKMAALGLGANDIRAMKPELIYCSITGFGQNGPYSGRPAYDHIVQGMSGLMSVTGTDVSGPVRVGTPITDYIVGQAAALAITAALMQRERTGQGEVIDAAMLDATMSIMGPVIAEWTIGGRTPQLAGNKPFSRSPFSGCFDTRDGKVVVVGNTASQIRAFLAACGLDKLLLDPRVEDWKLHPELSEEVRPLLEEVFRTRSAMEWEQLLNDASVPCCKIRSVPEIVQDPHVRDRGILLDVHVPSLDDTITIPGVGFKIGDASGHITSPPPAFGQHTEAVLAEVGYNASAIADLIRERVAVVQEVVIDKSSGNGRPKRAGVMNRGDGEEVEAAVLDDLPSVEARS